MRGIPRDNSPVNVQINQTFANQAGQQAEHQAGLFPNNQLVIN